MFRFVFFSLTIFLSLPLSTFAETKYEPLIILPGINASIEGNFSDYVNFLYAMAIAIAALLAVVKIIVAGVKYMTSEVVSAKGNAKGEIVAALLGLLLIVGAYIILYTINPQLTNQQLKFKGLPPAPAIRRTPSVQATGPTPTTPGINPPTPTNEVPAPTTNPPGGVPAPSPANPRTTFDPSCVRGAGTRTQGTVINQYFNVSSCTTEAAARSYLYDNICKPNPVLNGGNGLLYCKQ